MIEHLGHPHLFEATDIRMHFGGVKAVDGVSFSLEPGRLYGLVGPNGSGKTTLVNAISRVLPLSEGRLCLDGADITKAPPYKVSRAGVSRTFQSIRLIPHMTVLANVMLGGDYATSDHEDERPSSRRRMRRKAASLTRDNAEDALATVGLRHLAHTFPGSLSYGTQRRVEIARALAMRPKLLLLDEPVAGMNRHERDEITELVLKLSANGITQLLIEHDLRMVLSVADSLFVMNLGKLIAEGPPLDVVNRPDVMTAYLGERKARDISRLDGGVL